MFKMWLLMADFAVTWGTFDRSTIYGDRLAVFAHFHLNLSSGAGLVFTSDLDRKVPKGPIQHSDHKHGEVVDYRVALGTETTHPAEPMPSPEFRLVGEQVECVQEILRL
jgi:hypothetical protein